MQPRVNSELVVYTDKHDLLSPLHGPDVQQQIDLMLAGSGLTAKQLLLDMAAYLTANPRTARQATPATLFNCLYVAARLHTTFGDGGLWIIPGVQTDDDEDNPAAASGKGVRPQESEKFLTGRAAEAGATLFCTLVWKSNEPVKIDRDRYGEIIGIEMAADDPFARHDESDLIGCFVRADFLDGREPMLHVLSRQELDVKRDHSAAARKGRAPAWKDDWMRMYERSGRAALARIVVPIRTKCLGGAGSLIGPDLTLAAPDAERNGSMPLLTSGAIAADLESRGSVPVVGEALLNLRPKPVDFVDETRAVLDDLHTDSAPLLAFNMFAEAFLELPREAEALAITYREGAREWTAKIQSAEHLQMMRQIRAAFWTAAARAGYPQPEARLLHVDMETHKRMVK